ncbi:MAG: TetR/AcrR family transcriptional regulator [Rhodocyclales bacterium]|nr:TetR/AcrR family transcriptional regulator [Rhodocyclales bacterium]
MNKPIPRRSSTVLRQQEIVEAALRLAQFASPDGITTQAIADEVGLTQGALFRHFPSKEAIWIAVLAWVRERFRAEIDAAAARGATPIEQLGEIFRAHVRFVTTHPAVPRLIFHELQRPVESPARAEVRQIMEPYRQRILTLLKAAKATEAVAADLDLPSAAAMFVGTIQGLVMQTALADGVATLEARAKKMFPLFLSAIGARP